MLQWQEALRRQFQELLKRGERSFIYLEGHGGKNPISKGIKLQHQKKIDSFPHSP